MLGDVVEWERGRGPKTVQLMKSEEKGSDVNIGTYILDELAGSVGVR